MAMRDGGRTRSAVAAHALLRWSLMIMGLAVVLLVQSARADVALRVEAQPIGAPVQAFVTVTDASGDPVGGLAAADFLVRLDGVDLTSAPTFSLPPAQAPDQKVSVVFAMDYSSSVQSVALESMQQAVITFINSMNPGDYAAIVKFNNTNPDRASVVQPFTEIDAAAGTAALIAAVNADYAGRQSNVFDGIVVSVGQFTTPPVPLPPGPHAIILVSDGAENNSTSDINAAVAAAVDANISIFTVGVGDFTSAVSQQVLNSLANETGGDFYPAPSSTEITDAYVQISQLLNNEYLLSFDSTITDCSTHTIEVVVAGEVAPATADFTRCASLLAPDVRGMTLAEATAALASADLIVGTVTDRYSTMPVGAVVGQNPVVGTVVNPGSSVNLSVSIGPPPVAVPSVVGTTQEAATTALTAAGLVVGTVTQQPSTTVPTGSVISQSPAAGTEVAADSAVDLVVSSGLPAVAVPSLVGLTQSAATTALTGAGLVVGTVTQQSNSTVASGNVISQSPAAGGQVAPGSSVSLVVSSGPAKKSGGGGGATGPLEVLLAGLLLAVLTRRRRGA